MKAFIRACAVMAILIFTVILNSFAIDGSIDKIYENIHSLPEKATEDSITLFDKAYEDFLSRGKFLSLTVSHSELAEIDKDFAELLGAAKAKDEDAIIITKSRLEKSLFRLKRLYGLNFESIF